MRSVNSTCRITSGLVLLLSFSPIAWAQQAPAFSDQERSSLLAERDAKAEKAIALANAGEFEPALDQLDEVFRIEQSIFGEADEELLGTLDLQAQIAEASQDRFKEIEFRRRAVDIGRSLYEQDEYRLRDLQLELKEARDNSTRTDQQRRQLARADSLNAEVIRLFKQGEFAAAIDRSEEVIELRSAVLGNSHPSYATSLFNLAALHDTMGDYAQAEPRYAEVNRIREKVLGKEHPTYARSLNILAKMYRAMGDYIRAEPLYMEAKLIREKTLGHEHPDYAESLNNVASMYQLMGNYLQAEAMFLEANAIDERVLGKEHPDYATSLSNLSMLYREMGDYARSEPMCVAAMEVRERTLGIKHPQYAVSLNNLADLYASMGDEARAEPLYVKAMKIKAEVLGEEHPDCIVSLNNLAVFHQNSGDYSRAEPLFVKAKLISEKAYGKSHPRYAAGLTNLALLYDLMGKHKLAEPLYLESQEIMKRVLGKEHPWYTASLINLAGLYARMGNHDRIEPLLVEAKVIREKILGNEHPDYAVSLNSLAAYHESVANYRDAERLRRQAIDIMLRHLEMTAKVQSEQQQLLMNRSVRHSLDRYLNCCIDGELGTQPFVERVVSWKGSILRRGRGLRLASSDPIVADQFRQLRLIASQISNLTQLTPAQDQMDAWRKRLETLAEQQRKLETELIRLSPAYRESVERISLEDVRQSIPDGGVLVDYLEYQSEQGRAIVATLIPRVGEPRLIALGSAEKAGANVDTWRQSFGMTSEARLAGEALRRQLWKPLWDHVRDADLILVSTDGVLGRMPLAALPGRKPDSYLIEDHRLVLIPVPQMLPTLVKQTDATILSRDLLLVGDVDYGQPAAGDDPDWPGLAETRREVDFIKNLFMQNHRSGPDGIVELREDDATESALCDLAPKCRILHLATHGFFAAAKQRNALSPSVSAESRGPNQRPGMFGEQREFVLGVSPGQLSGLVFADANRPPQPIDLLSSVKSTDDGIMTADEIAYLPLDGVELAVLSACETGLGEVAGGEGLIGIQRAFQVSGVDSVLATMWKVDDKMTRKLIERFYLNYLDGKMSKSLSENPRSAKREVCTSQV